MIITWKCPNCPAWHYKSHELREAGKYFVISDGSLGTVPCPACGAKVSIDGLLAGQYDYVAPLGISDFLMFGFLYLFNLIWMVFVPYLVTEGYVASILVGILYTIAVALYASHRSRLRQKEREQTGQST